MALWKDENIADSITCHAVDFIKENSARPFFMYFATNDIHGPRFPHERFRGTSEMGLRGDAIAQFDWCVGEIVRALESVGVLDNTLIILTSDNGPVLDDGYDDAAEELVGEHSPTAGLRGGKYSAFEGGTRVPFIVHWPAVIDSPDVNEQLVSQIDFLAVMTRIVGDTSVVSVADGHSSQADVWLGKASCGRPFVVGMASNHTLTYAEWHWKYIEPKGGPAMVPWGPRIETGYSTVPQLFRRAGDEYDETLNLGDDNPSVVGYMQRELDAVKNERGYWVVQ